MALLIAWSRMYICVHFVTDILGGIGTGLLSAALGKALMERLRR